MSSSRKVLVGLFVIGGFLLFALGLFWIGDRRLLFSQSLHLHTQFSNLSGLEVGSKVMVRGMDAGEVLAIEVPGRPGDKFRLRFRVLERFRPILRADSVASIQVEGLVGSKVLQVEAGSEQAAEVHAGTMLPSKEPVEISAVIQQSVDLIRHVDGAVDDVQKRLIKTIDTVTDVGERAQKLVISVGQDTDEILNTSRRVAGRVEKVVDAAADGKGLVGKLLTDEKLYVRLENTTRQVESTAATAGRVSQRLENIVGDIEAQKLGQTISKTAGNVEQATANLTRILEQFKPPGGPDSRGLLDDVRDSLQNTREATSDLAENMEALKRNFFFRGYFNRRGFFDLDAISLEDYRQGKVAPKRERKYSWLQAGELFKREPTGEEVLSEAGRVKLGEAMVPYLRYAPNTLLMVEGYTPAGSETEVFLQSRERARLVRRYLIDRFGLKPNFVGAIALGKDVTATPSNQPWDGVSLVFFPAKEK